MTVRSTTYRFRPKLLPTAFFAAMAVALFCLGFWQVQRLAWKESLIADIEAQAARPALAVRSLADLRGQDSLYRRVSLQGRAAGMQFPVGPRTHEGADGYHLIEAVRLSGGGTVFVNRGWIPKEGAADAAPLSGSVKLQGVIADPARTSFTPENEPAKNNWYWPEVKAMAAAGKIKGEVSPRILYVAPPEKDDSLPVEVAPAQNLRNNHLSYAVFWFLMAAVLTGVYVATQMRRGGSI